MTLDKASTTIVIRNVILPPGCTIVKRIDRDTNPKVCLRWSASTIPVVAGHPLPELAFLAMARNDNVVRKDL
jgi:hypothetical protein